MSQKTMLVLAASLTAFVLVITGGVFARVSDASASGDLAAVINPTVRDLWNQREAAYWSLINQANQRLQAGNAPSPMAGAATPPGQVFSAAVSPNQAAMLALLSAPGATLTRQPELVSYEGIPAYEVATTYGFVYIDATTGSVLYDGGSQMQVAATSGEWEDNESDD